MSIGEAVKARRERKGWSQEELAAKAGVSRSLVQSIEKSRRPPRPSNLRKIASAFGTDLDGLMDQQNDRPSRDDMIALRARAQEALESDDPEQIKAMVAELADALARLGRPQD